MAEGVDSDDTDRQKTESILLWVRNVEIATQQGPHAPPDRGLISNPDLTSFTPDPTGVLPSTVDPDPMQASSPLLSSPPFSSHHPTTSIYNPSEPLPHLQRNRALAQTRSASLSLSSKRPSVILSQLPSSRSSLRQTTRGPPPPSGRSTKKPSLIHQHLPVASAQSKNVESNPANQDVASKDTVESKGKSSEPGQHAAKETTEQTEERKETVSAKDDIMSGDEQRLRELRSLARTRQTSLSPLPAPTTLPSLPPTFNLPNVRVMSPKHPWLKKKLPTVSEIRPRGRVPHPPHSKLLNRATTSPGELSTPTEPKSAPSSPKPSKAVPTSRVEGNNKGVSSVQDDRNEMENLNRHLERRKSFSHDDVSQLQLLEQLDVGGVSPAASYSLVNNMGAPDNQQSLVAKGGFSEESEKSIERSSVGKVESVSSDEAIMRSNSGGTPSSQSISPVVSDRGDDSDSMNQASPHHHHHPQSTSLLPVHQEDHDHKKVGASCPLSPPSLSSPRTPHSPLMRQCHISRSPSPSLPYTPPTSPLHKSWISGSHVGTESGNVISKQKLKLLNEGQTFSFDTSEDSDFTKVSRQPKFLLKKSQQCPVSPPPALLSPPSTQRSPGALAHYQQKQHSPPNSADPRTSTKSPSPTQLSGPSFRLKNPDLSEQLLLRRGSTPISLSLTQTQQGGGGQFSAKISSRLSSNRSSIHTVNPAARSVVRSPQATRKFAAPKSIKESKESTLKLFEGRNTGTAQTRCQNDPAGKGPVNRQDSGLGTLSTISNKFNL